MAIVALLGCALAAYWVGSRAQRYRQARADVRDARGKWRNARAARSALRRAAVTGWLALGGVAVLAGFVVLAGANR